MQQQQATADGLVLQQTEYLYEPGSFRPMAQVTHHEQGSELHYIVTDHAGTPQELCNEQGDIVWRGEQALWGHYHGQSQRHWQRREEATNDSIQCDLRYQGQLEDAESGLYYNVNRYYDADSGQYLSPDPIGFAGGLRPQAYVANPLEWVDPLGLNPEELIRYKPRNEISAMSGGRTSAISRAWVQEKNLINETGMGTRHWSNDEIELIKNTPNTKLTATMSRAGYTGHHINSVKGNAALGEKWKGDPRNIVFLQNHRHPSGVNEHVHGLQGHRGSTSNSTNGRLIDREAMLNNHRRKRCK